MQEKAIASYNQMNYTDAMKAFGELVRSPIRIITEREIGVIGGF